MSDFAPFSSLVTRRQVVKGAVRLAALGAGSTLVGGHVAPAAALPVRIESDVAGSDRERVAIIGAGAGGVMAAYFLAWTFDVDLFEARPKIGGHCDTHVIDYQGQGVLVDVGAQFFHPDTHPIYVTLLELVGLYDPADPDGDETLAAPGSLCIFPAAGGPPVFSSSHPLATPLRAIEFAVYSQLARHAVLSDLPWEITVDDWVAGLSVTQSFKDDVVYPWITALIGCSSSDALTASARSILQTFALAFPANILEGATTYNSRIGLQGNLQRLLDLSPTVQVHLNAPTQALTLQDAGWFVQTPTGRHGPYTFVVLNAPPHAGRKLLAGLPAFAEVTALLDAYEYFDSRIVIHTDPAYVYPDPSDWAAYNAEIDDLQCEGSVWYGGLDPKLASGAVIDVFKSWALRRCSQPTQILLQRWFKHPLINQATIDAASALRPLQGQGGLFFSGIYTNGFDSQESAVYSAMQLAESLAPDSPTLAALKALLAARGLSGISYSL
jgi:predicted NAD/FAD-binding protein